MSLRWSFILAFIVLAVASTASVWSFDRYAVHTVETGAAAQFIIVSAALVGIIVLLVVGLLFLILNRLIARPLRELQRGVSAFTKDGTHAPMLISRLAPSEVRGLAAGFIDLMAAVEATHGHEEDISRMKSDFISTAAHQIRTPLTGIRWALEALQQSGLTADQQPLVQNAVDKSHELVAIIKTLLDISSIESGKYAYTFKAVDLAHMAAAVTKDMAPMAAERNVSVTYLGGAPVPDVRADEERVKWIVNNLVENAIRYTPAGGSVRVTLDQGSGRVFLHVTDTGIGIKPEDRGNIFARFYRGENARAKENEGNGLGLYIARNIAKDHGGSLEFADNQGGPGTTFTLSLPLAG